MAESGPWRARIEHLCWSMCSVISSRCSAWPDSGSNSGSDHTHVWFCQPRFRRHRCAQDVGQPVGAGYRCPCHRGRSGLCRAPHVRCVGCCCVLWLQYAQYYYYHYYLVSVCHHTVSLYVTTLSLCHYTLHVFLCNYTQSLYVITLCLSLSSHPISLCHNTLSLFAFTFCLFISPHSVSLCLHILSLYVTTLCLSLSPHSDRLVGLVVKASASRAEGPGFKSRLRRDFFGVESYQWLKNRHSSGYPARRLAW